MASKPIIAAQTAPLCANHLCNSNAFGNWIFLPSTWDQLLSPHDSGGFIQNSTNNPALSIDKFCPGKVPQKYDNGYKI